MAKNVTNGEETEEIPLADDAVLEAPVELVEPSVAPVAAKRALGVKEPIVFKWKVIGASQGMVLTLFKSVEREEADAQAERLQKENYYRDVRVLEASAKVEQPPQKAPKKGPAKSEAPAKSTAAKPAEAARKPAKAAPMAKKPVPKAAAKPAGKPAKKKTASTSSSKRASKGR